MVTQDERKLILEGPIFHFRGNVRKSESEGK